MPKIQSLSGSSSAFADTSRRLIKKACMCILGQNTRTCFLWCRFFVLDFVLGSDCHSLHFVVAHFVLTYSSLALCAITLHKIRCAKRNGTEKTSPKRSFAVSIVGRSRLSWILLHDCRCFLRPQFFRLVVSTAIDTSGLCN